MCIVLILVKMCIPFDVLVFDQSSVVSEMAWQVVENMAGYHQS